MRPVVATSSVNELFDQLLAYEADRKLPPVASWHPTREGAIDIRIAADGTWYHEGSVIGRPALVRLFSTILRRDPEGFCLVTPAEKLAIEVEDAPFVIVDLEVKGAGADQQILLITNVGEAILLGPDHPLRVAGPAVQPRPYVEVRAGLEALIGRSTYYRLADLCSQEADGFWLQSAGVRFRLG